MVDLPLQGAKPAAMEQHIFMLPPQDEVANVRQSMYFEKCVLTMPEGVESKPCCGPCDGLLASRAQGRWSLQIFKTLNPKLVLAGGSAGGSAAAGRQGCTWGCHTRHAAGSGCPSQHAPTTACWQQETC